MEQQNPPNDKNRFESDTQKIVHRHLEDPNHVISDEEIAGIRIGMMPPADEPTKRAIEDGEDRIADHKADKEDDLIPGAQKITPWNTVDPS